MPEAYYMWCLFGERLMVGVDIQSYQWVDCPNIGRVGVGVGASPGVCRPDRDIRATRLGRGEMD